MNSLPLEILQHINDYLPVLESISFICTLNLPLQFRFDKSPLYAWYFLEQDDVACLKWMHENNFKMFKELSEYAAAGGYLKCLQFTHQNGYDWNEKVCTAATKNGHLHCVKYMHEQSLIDEDKRQRVWNAPNVAYMAATRGHLHILKYVFQHDDTRSPFICTQAAEHGHLACLQYAYEQGCDWAINFMERITRTNHYDCLIYALHHGCSHESICDEFVKNVNFEGLKWAHERGYTWTENAYIRAARRHDLPCFKYLFEHEYLDHDCAFDIVQTYEWHEGIKYLEHVLKN